MGAYNDDVLFIHIPKTGGTSVKRYMAEYLPGTLWPDPRDPAMVEASRLPIGHVRLTDIERFTGRPLDSWKLILAVLRDPYEQQVSQWMFWRERYARGSTHIHDTVAAMYSQLTGWLEDPRCDFHVWYRQYVGYPDLISQQTLAAQPAPEGQNRYADFGGYYRFWLEVDGQIPANVTTIDMHQIDEQVPKLLSPFAGLSGGSLRALPERKNPSYHNSDVSVYYTSRAARLVENKFAWTFAQKKYPRWYYSDVGR